MTEQTQGQQAPARVVCPASKEAAVRYFIFAAIAIGLGLYCFYDVHAGKYPWKDNMGLNELAGYYFNHWGAVVLPLAGLFPLVLGVLSLRPKLVADEEGIGFAGKEKLPWSAIRAVDASLLADKQLLRLHYDDAGEERVLELASYKFQNFRDFVALLENKVPPAKDEPDRPEGK
jgi:hypothetical protein